MSFCKRMCSSPTSTSSRMSLLSHDSSCEWQSLPLSPTSTACSGGDPRVELEDIPDLEDDSQTSSSEDGFVRQVSNESFLAYADPLQTLIFLDWDDTIFP
eukprot:CAMPEP_0197925356 /NCGR_PEP_ID=MMETSP1439-20131203/97290_1 /TAXON_ID=66791 /ORGANISM="Gonyaulax spinifera, Strain CCMP409" /LENGTH=99 /DNA_ID=CAMNT_0043547833 /DNA_START=9 /DNA_END=305 /DNA_ORIENTATION=+